MPPPYAMAVAIVAVLVLFLIASYFWYNRVGWRAFSFAGGDRVEFAADGGKPAGLLRFKQCTFAVTSPGGQTRTQDVTANLNAMAAAYSTRDGASGFALGGASQHPLNAFSFVIPGFNDRQTVPDPTAWKTARASLVGQQRTL